MKRHVVNLMTWSCAFILLACESTTDNNLEQARQCTDNAAKISLQNPPLAAGMASGCEAMIVSNNLTSPEAYKIWFGAILIEDQLIANIAAAANVKGSHTGNVDGLNSMLPLLIANPASDATKLLNIALLSNKASLINVAGLISMATTLNSLAGLTSATSPASAQAAISTCAGSGACATQLAASFSSLAASACSSPADNASTDPNNLCNKTKAIQNIAGANPTPTQIANAIATYAAQTH